MYVSIGSLLSSDHHIIETLPRRREDNAIDRLAILDIGVKPRFTYISRHKRSYPNNLYPRHPAFHCDCSTNSLSELVV